MIVGKFLVYPSKRNKLQLRAIPHAAIVIRNMHEPIEAMNNPRKGIRTPTLRSLGRLQEMALEFIGHSFLIFNFLLQKTRVDANTMTNNSVIDPISNSILALVFIVLLALSAQVNVPLPFSPVPVSLQTFMVLLAGLTLGPIWGSITLVGYLLAGLANLPVFSDGASGYEALTGPTGGYLVGFVCYAGAAGYGYHHLKWKNRHVLVQIALLFTLTIPLIFLPGVWVLKHQLGLTLHEALQSGFTPFQPGNIIKTAAGVFLARWVPRATIDKLFASSG